MKINCPSSRVLISADEKLLFNVGGTVSIFDISGEKAVKLKRLNKLRNSSHIAISFDEKLVAYKNTSGHIAVHEIETGELLLKSKCLAEAGEDLFFINKNKQILSSEWGGKVFILDIETGDTNVISKFPVSSVNLFSISDDKFILSGSCQNKYTRIFELSLTEKISSKELYSMPQYMIEDVCVAVSGDDIFFFARSTDCEKYSIVSFNTSTNEMCFCFDIDELLGFKGDLISEYGYFTSMCVSKDKRYLLIGMSLSIIVVDLFEKKSVGTIKMDYITSIQFILSDTKVVIGTWTNIQIIDFPALIL